MLRRSLSFRVLAALYFYLQPSRFGLTLGTIKEKGELKTKYEEVFGINVKYFENTVDLVQVVKLKSNVKTNLAGNVQYMACNDEACLLQPR